VKVLILVHGLFPGFSAPAGKEYAKNLHRLGIDVAVAVIGKLSETKGADAFAFPVFVIDEPSIAKQYRKLIPIVRKFDIVHYFPGKGFELLPLFAKRTRFVMNRLSVSVTRDRLKNRVVDILKRLQPLFYSCAIFTDEPLARKLRPFFRKRVILLPVGYPSELFYPNRLPPKNNDEKVLMYHGAVRPERQLDRLIRVIARLPEEYKMKIIGGGLARDEVYRRELGALAVELGCEHRVILTNMPQELIRNEIETAYLGLSHVPPWECYQDQFVMKTLEYLACGLPVITTATRYNKDFQKTLGKDSILLTDGSVDDIVDKVLHAENYIVSFYKEETQKRIREHLAQYSSRFIVEHNLLNIYRSVLNGTFGSLACD